MGIKSIETKNIQGLTLMKISFYPGHEHGPGCSGSQRVFQPYTRTIPRGHTPFIIRFDASTLPVGQLVLSSPQRSNNELVDLANVYVRSSFTSIPGLVAPPPFGGNGAGPL